MVEKVRASTPNQGTRGCGIPDGKNVCTIQLQMYHDISMITLIYTTPGVCLYNNIYVHLPNMIVMCVC